jgi:hypothetical protein
MSSNHNFPKWEIPIFGQQELLRFDSLMKHHKLEKGQAMKLIGFYSTALVLGMAANVNALVGVENLSLPPWLPALSVPIGNDLGTTHVVTDNASGFRTGPSGGSYELKSVTLDLAETTTNGGGFTVSVWNNDAMDSVGVPGTQLAVLSGQSNPAGPGYFTFTTPSPLRLSDSTTYWIIASVPHDGLVNSLYNWSVESATYDNGLAGWSIIDFCRPRHYVDGVPNLWGIGTAGNRFSVEVAAIPEPSTLNLAIALAIASTTLLRLPAPHRE